MKRFLVVLAAAGALVFVAGPALAQETHSHSHGAGEELGEVHFPTSCSAEVEADFTRAVALLHSFGYEESRRAFEVVAEKDPACGMAYWGIAMTYYHPIWAAPNAAELAAGRAAAEKAAALGGGTERERAYIDAINVFYRDSQTPAPRRAGGGLRGVHPRRLAPVPGRPRSHDLLRAAAVRALERSGLRAAEEGRRDPERSAARSSRGIRASRTT